MCVCECVCVLDSNGVQAARPRHAQVPAAPRPAISKGSATDVCVFWVYGVGVLCVLRPGTSHPRTCVVVLVLVLVVFLVGDVRELLPFLVASVVRLDV